MLDVAELSERERIFNEHKSKILSSHESFVGAGKSIGNSLLAAANFRREVGIYLESLKTATYSVEGIERKVVPHGEWDKLFSSGRERDKNRTDAVIDFSTDTALRYIQFASRFPEPITELRQIVRDGKEMLLDAGEIEKVMPDFTPQPIANAYSLAGKFWQSFNQKFLNGCLKSEDRANWTPEYRDGIKESLKPIVEFYQTL